MELLSALHRFKTCVWFYDNLYRNGEWILQGACKCFESVFLLFFYCGCIFLLPPVWATAVYTMCSFNRLLPNIGVTSKLWEFMCRKSDLFDILVVSVISSTPKIFNINFGIATWHQMLQMLSNALMFTLFALFARMSCTTPSYWLICDRVDQLELEGDFRALRAAGGKMLTSLVT